MPPGSNNPFGIKAVGDQPSVESPTREVINGENVTTTVNVTAINQPVHITVPPASQTSAPSAL